MRSHSSLSIRQYDRERRVAGLPTVSRRRAVLYWVITVGLAWELAFGGLSDLLRLEYVRVIVDRLGYPLYLLTILGVWKLLAAVVLLAPRLPLVKEWAYAGSFFAFTGASASHIAAESAAIDWLGPLIGACATVASWALRPPARRIDETTAPLVIAPATTAEHSAITAVAGSSAPGQSARRGLG
jgi:DoxX-like family